MVDTIGSVTLLELRDERDDLLSAARHFLLEMHFMACEGRTLELAVINPVGILATAGHFLSVQQAAQILKDRLGDAGRAVSTRRLPNWLLRLVGLLDPEIRGMLPELGKRKDATAEKAQRLLGWKPRSPDEAIVATANSLADLHPLKAG
jgi:nucleoside-diphosphate-sugar epimerase